MSNGTNKHPLPEGATLRDETPQKFPLPEGAVLTEEPKKKEGWKIGGLTSEGLSQILEGGDSGVQSTLKEVLEKNKDVPFVKRILNPDEYPVVENVDGTVSSHLMSYSEADGKYFVYPTLVYKDGDRLEKPDDPYREARKSGNFVEFDNEDAAAAFASGSWKEVEIPSQFDNKLAQYKNLRPEIPDQANLRLPTPKELTTIIDKEKVTGQTLDAKAFWMPKEQVEGPKVDNWLEYIFSEGYNQSTIGLVDNIINGKERWNIGDYEPGTVENAVAFAISMAMDSPLFIVSGGVGGIALKGTARGAVKAGNVIGKKLITRGAETKLGKEVVQKGVEKFAQRIGSSGAALGFYYAEHEALNQMVGVHGGEQTGKRVPWSDIDWGVVRKEGYIGVALGAGLGVLGTTGAILEGKVLSGMEKGFGKVATKVGMKTGEFATEVTMFSYGDAALRDDRKLSDVTMEDWLHTAIVLGTLKVSGVAQRSIEKMFKAPQFEKGMENEAEFEVKFSPEEMDLINKGRTTEDVIDHFKADKEYSELSTVLANENIPLVTKEKLLWALEGVRPKDRQEVARVDVERGEDGKSFMKLYNHNDVLLDIKEYSTVEKAQAEANSVINEIIDQQNRQRAAELSITEMADAQSRLDKKKFSYDEFNAAQNISAKYRTPEERKIIQDFVDVVDEVINERKTEEQKNAEEIRKAAEAKSKQVGKAGEVEQEKVGVAGRGEEQVRIRNLEKDRLEAEEVNKNVIEYLQRAIDESGEQKLEGAVLHYEQRLKKLQENPLAYWEEFEKSLKNNPNFEKLLKDNPEFIDTYKEAKKQVEYYKSLKEKSFNEVRPEAKPGEEVIKEIPEKDVLGKTILTAEEWNKLAPEEQEKRSNAIDVEIKDSEKNTIKVDYNIAPFLKRIFNLGIVTDQSDSGTISDHPGYRYIKGKEKGEIIKTSRGYITFLKPEALDSEYRENINKINSKEDIEIIRESAKETGIIVEDGKGKNKDLLIVRMSDSYSDVEVLKKWDDFIINLENRYKGKEGKEIKLTEEELKAIEEEAEIVEVGPKGKMKVVREGKEIEAVPKEEGEGLRSFEKEELAKLEAEIGEHKSYIEGKTKKEIDADAEQFILDFMENEVVPDKRSREIRTDYSSLNIQTRDLATAKKNILEGKTTKTVERIKELIKGWYKDGYIPTLQGSGGHELVKGGIPVKDMIEFMREAKKPLSERDALVESELPDVLKRKIEDEGITTENVDALREGEVKAMEGLGFEKKDINETIDDYNKIKEYLENETKGIEKEKPVEAEERIAEEGKEVEGTIREKEKITTGVDVDTEQVREETGLDKRDKEREERLKKVDQSISERLGRLAGIQEISAENPFRKPDVFEDLVGLIKDLSLKGEIKIEKGIDHVLSKIKELLPNINGKFFDEIQDKIADILNIQRSKSAEERELDKELGEDQELNIENPVKPMDIDPPKEPPVVDDIGEIQGDHPGKYSVPSEKGYSKLEDVWFANKDWEQHKAINVEAVGFQDRIGKTVGPRPKVGRKKWTEKSQEVDNAIHVYIDLKRNPEHYDMFYDKLTKDQKKIVDLAKNLTPEQKKIADEIVEIYEDVGSRAKDAGVIRNIVDNYVSRTWDFGEKASHEFYRKFGTATRHARMRVLDTILEGWSKGYKLKINGATNNLAAYKVEIANVIESRRLIKDGMKIKNQKGQFVFSHYMEEGYKQISHPNFTWWDYRGSIKLDILKENLIKISKEKISQRVGEEGEVESRPIDKLKEIVTESLVARGMTEEEAQNAVARIQGAKNRNEIVNEIISQVEVREEKVKGVKFRPVLKKGFIITEDGAILEKRPIYAPEKIAKRLNRILNTSKLKQNWVEETTAFNAGIKATILQTSLFHHFAFSRSYLFGGALAKGGDVNFIRAYKEGLRSIQALKPEIELLVRNGLTFGRMQEWDELMLRKDEKFDKMLGKIGIPKVVRNPIRSFQRRQAYFLFNKFGAGLKAYTALLEYNHLLDKYPELEPNARAKQVAELVNDDFGGLHLERMGRDKTSQHLFRLVFLAPDWTESNVRTMYKALAHPKVVEAKRKLTGGEKLTPEEKSWYDHQFKVYRRFWGRVALRGMALTTAANLAIALLDENDDDTKRTYLQKVAYRYKRAWEKGGLRWLEVDITPVYRKLTGNDENISYFSVLGHFKDPIKFIVKPAQSIRHKSGPLFRTALEAFTGSDWRGWEFTDAGELLGLDDRGRLAGQLTKFPMGGSEALKYEQIPSFMLHTARSYLPIQGQNILAYATGEVDWFNAFTKSAGLTVSVVSQPQEEKKSRYSMIKEAVKKGEDINKYLEKAKIEFGEENLNKNKTNWSKEFEIYSRVINGEYNDDVVYNLYDRNISNDVKAAWLKGEYNKLGSDEYKSFLRKYYTKINGLNNVISDDLYNRQVKLTGVTIPSAKKGKTGKVMK